MIQITREEFVNFQEYYEKMSSVMPDYRVGQAFLNYFPNIDKEMIAECLADEFKLYNERSEEVCWNKIRNMIK